VHDQESTIRIHIRERNILIGLLFSYFPVGDSLYPLPADHYPAYHGYPERLLSFVVIESHL